MSDKPVEYKTVPREPTKEMISAALAESRRALEHRLFCGLGEMWIAMFDAAPVATSSKTSDDERARE